MVMGISLRILEVHVASEDDAILIVVVGRG